MEEYIKKLVEHEKSTYFREYCSNPKQASILLGWVALNSIWDFLWSPEAKYQYQNVKLRDIILTWTSPDMNKILLEDCNRSTKELELLIEKDSEIKNKLESWASFWNEPILLVELQDWKFKSFDWMHRIIWHVLKGQKTINAYVLKNYWKFLPHNEPHVVYDIIKAYQRSQRNDQDKNDLQWALRLMAKNTWNMKAVLENRFNKKYINDDELQSIIKTALN
jgi:hypothetical protein